MFDADVISFAHGEGLRRPHATVITELKRIIDEPNAWPIENYMFLHRDVALEERISQSFLDIGVPDGVSRAIVLDAGTTRLLIAFLQTVARPGDTVLTGPSFYHPLAGWCAYLGLKLHCLRTSSASAFRVTAADVEDWCVRNSTPGSRPVLVLFNPNMTGAVSTAAELQDLAAILRKYDMIAVEDAIFAGLEFATPAPRNRLARFAPERTLTVSGASKLHALANLRIGWACGPAPLTEHLSRFVTSSAATISHLARVAAAAALRAPRAYLERNRRECQVRAALIAELVGRANLILRQSGFAVADPIQFKHPCEGGHSVLIDFDRLAGFRCPDGTALADSIDLTRFFLQRARVAFSPGLSIGWNGLQLRCNFSSVGTRATYPASLMAERHCFARPRQSEAVPDTDAVYQGAIDAGFGTGRALIEAAFLERVVPAIARLQPSGSSPSRPTPRPSRQAAGVPLGLPR